MFIGTGIATWDALITDILGGGTWRSGGTMGNRLLVEAVLARVNG